MAKREKYVPELPLQMQGKPTDLNEPLYIGEEMGDYLPEYYCMNCGKDLEFEHQEKCKKCGQAQLWNKYD